VNRSRIIVLIAVLVLAVALLASTALAGKDAGKKWGAPSLSGIPRCSKAD
jgi:hypothetical protein